MFTEDQIKKMPRKNLSIDEFLKLSARIAPDVKLDRDQVFSLGNGAFLGIHQNKNGRWYRMHLQTIFMKPFNLRYSCHKDIKQGRELLISSFRLPRGKVEIKK